MKVTIKDVAREAKVSIATVSHVINKTRYVSPDLLDKVNDAIQKTGYIVKTDISGSSLKVGKGSMVNFIVPNLGGTIYSQLIESLSKGLSDRGYLLSVHLSEDDINVERHILTSLLADKRTAGIILSPVSGDSGRYKKVFSSGIPVVCLERTFKNCMVTSVLSDNVNSIYMGTKHLIDSGHERIGIILEDRDLTTVSERLLGYKKALEEARLSLDEELIVMVDLYNEKNSEDIIFNSYKKSKPTAYIAGGNRLTLTLLTALQNNGLDCPEDISVIGFGDDKWCQLNVPPLTTIKQNAKEMGEIAAQNIVSIIQENKDNKEEIRVSTKLSIRKSTQMIGRGPFGEKATPPEEIILTEEEKLRLRSSNFKVAISFHYCGTAWANLHERGIRDTLAKYGVAVISVTDAHFDPELQIAQLEGLSMQKPDAVIAIPSDDQLTSEKFKELSAKTKLIFMSNIPSGMNKDQYASCVSVNERENGHNAGILLGEYFKDRQNVKVGIIGHGAPFYGTHLRDKVAAVTLTENYPNVEIVANENFYKIDNAYALCKKMLIENPEIEGLYISWDVPALEAIRAIEELNRTDIAIVTFDLDTKITEYMARNEMVIGLSTQRPYEQGVAVAMAAAKALLGKNGYKYIGVPPYVVQRKNILRAWKDIMHEKAPEYLENILL